MKLTIIVTLFFFVVVPANAEYYGNNTITPLIEDEKPVIHLPGGAKVKDGEYIVNDVYGRDRANTTPFSVGFETEPETGTQHIHAREYDSSTGRWISLDSEREDSTPYSYVGNNPINFVDVDGNTRYSLWLYSNFGVTSMTE